jgi:hypothetical protein
MAYVGGAPSKSGKESVMTTLTIKTKTVRLKDGTSVVINADDFDPAIHSEPSKKTPPVKKRKAGRE